MYYKNLGTTLSFRRYEGYKNYYNIIATYRPCKIERDQFIVTLHLKKTIHKNGGEYQFEHPINTQIIAAKPSNIKSQISLMVNQADTNGDFDPYVKEFKAEIEDALSSL